MADQSPFQQPDDTPDAASGTGQSGMDMLLGRNGPRYQTWPERAARGIGNDIYTMMHPTTQPGTPENVDEMVGPVMRTVPTLAAGASPFAEENAVGIFGGKMGQTADLQNMEAAKTLKAAGMDDGSIWRMLGWYHHPDGMSRYEISDKDMSLSDDLTNGVVKNAPIADHVKHDQLFEAYPQLKNYTISNTHPDSWMANYRGLHYPGTQPDNGHIWINPKLDPDQAKSTLIHELQHAVQGVEGFPASGANTSEIILRAQKALAAKANDAYNNKDMDTVNELGDIINGLNKANPSQAYHHEAGEVEARNAQARNYLSNDGRWEMPPSQTASVPPDKQLIIPRGFKAGGTMDNKFAIGGNPQAFVERAASYGLRHEGFLNSGVAGRTDHIGLQVKNGSYVVPADVVSAAGQGNSLAGAGAFDKLLKQGPYGTSMGGIKAPKMSMPGNMSGNMKMSSSLTKMSGPGHGGGSMRMPTIATGGAVKKPRELVAPKANWHGASEGGPRTAGPEHHIPILAAGGEYIVSPETVARIGGGDAQKGFRILDQLVLKTRRKHISTLQKLKPPKKK